MNRTLAALLCVSMAGCLAPKRTWQERGQGVNMGGGPNDTTYLLAIDVASVDSGGPAALDAWAEEMERRYLRHVEVDGIVWQPLRSDTSLDQPDRYGSGGDSMIFTGVAAAGWAWKYRAVGDAGRLVEALRGLWILTHAAGPGVLCRAAFPSSRASEWGWPDAWSGREPDFMGESAPGLVDPVSEQPLPPMRYYTRGTKDQLTGLVFGLSVVWQLAEEPATGPQLVALIRRVVPEIVRDVVTHLRAYNWRIRNAAGLNDTTADDVDDLLKLAVLGLARATGMAVETEYQQEFTRFVQLAPALGAFDRYNNFQQYYAHGLRAERAYAIWLLDRDDSHRAAMVDYSERHWRRWTNGHGNAWLSWLWSAMSGETPDDEGTRALHELRLKPTRLWSSPLAGRWSLPKDQGFTAATFDTIAAWALPVYLRKPTAYFTWQKEPWDAGELPWDTLGLAETTGLDFLACYWLGKYHGFLE